MFDITTGKMPGVEIVKWMRGESEVKVLSANEQIHVADCLEHLQEWFWEDKPVGSFLASVLRNDFMAACGRADDINRKVLSLYAKFLYNCMPGNYRAKVKSL